MHAQLKIEDQIEDQIETLASQMVRQQGINFSSFSEAQRHLKKIKLDLRHLVVQGNKNLAQGLTYLSEDNTGHVRSYVAGVCSKLLKHISSSKKINKIIEADVLSNEHSLLFFSEAIEQFLDCGDVEKEQSVLSVLMALFPLNPQPYIYFGTSIWRSDGIDAAAAFYSEVLKVMPNPAIYYFAANCFYKNGDRNKTRELLQCGLDEARKSPEIYQHIEQLISEFSRKI